MSSRLVVFVTSLLCLYVSLCVCLSVCVHVFEGCSFERGGGCLHCGLGQIIVFGQTALFAQQGPGPTSHNDVLTCQ